MTITSSDLGGEDRSERTLAQHRYNLALAIEALGITEVFETVLKAVEKQLDSRADSSYLVEKTFAVVLRDWNK